VCASLRYEKEGKDISEMTVFQSFNHFPSLRVRWNEKIAKNGTFVARFRISTEISLVDVEHCNVHVSCGIHTGA